MYSEKNTVQIGEELGVTSNTISHWLKEYRIPLRDSSQARLPKGVTKLTKKELRRIYREKNIPQIAEELGVSNSTVRKWLKKYGIPIRNSSIIKSKSQFLDFLQKNKPARNLAGAVAILKTKNANGANGASGASYDLEKVLYELHNQEFKDQGVLHKMLQESRDEVYQLVQEGLTNLGTYLGEYRLDERAIIPVLLGQAIEDIPEEKIAPLEERILKILRLQYSPRFNENPSETMAEIQGKIKSTKQKGKLNKIYRKLYKHYHDVLKLGRELGGN